MTGTGPRGDHCGSVGREGGTGERIKVLVTVDPGTNAAWVLWEQQNQCIWTPQRIGRIKAPSAPETRRLLEQIVPDAARAHLVVEGQFYADYRASARRGYQSSPWQDVARLIELRCRWEDGAAELRMSSEVVLPATWIPKMTKGAPGKDSKARIAAMAAQWLPGIDLVADERDAALLGVWRIRGWGHQISVEIV